MTVRGIEYDSIDVSTDPNGYAGLRALGAMSTPVVAIGDRWVSGAAFDRLDEFFAANGRSTRIPERDARVVTGVGKAVGNIFGGTGSATVLDERQLAARLDTLLDKAIGYILELPDDMLDVPLPERGKEGRTVRGLAWHIGQVARDPLRAADGIAIVKAMHEYDPPDEMRSGRGLAGRAVEVRDALREVLAPERAVPTGVAEYFHGPYSFHGLLERTTWHVGTHLRQLAWILVEAGLDPGAGLTADETADLPMPLSVWK